MTHFEAAKVASFNPRAHAGRDRRRPIRRGWPSTSFNPRAHAGRDLARTSTIWAAPPRFQPTRPRGARRALRRFVYQLLRVSTHAPTRGATFPGARLPGVGAVSTHAPTRGATSAIDLIGRPRKTFQPTRPRGARLVGKYMQGASSEEFQPTRPRGARPPNLTRCGRTTCFNPRAHAGRDPRMRRRRCMCLSFNPRAHAGRDQQGPGYVHLSREFQPTRPRGARLPRCS